MNAHAEHAAALAAPISRVQQKEFTWEQIASTARSRSTAGTD